MVGTTFLRSTSISAQYYSVEYTAENTVLLYVCCIYWCGNRSQIKSYKLVWGNCMLQPAGSPSLTT